MADISELDQTLDKMLVPSQQRFQEFGQSLSGAGADAVAAWKSLQSFASGMPEVGKRAVDSITALQNDQALPREYRLAESTEQRTAAQTMLAKLNDGAHKAHGQLEAALTTALLPGPHRDPAQRLLIRDGLRTRYAHLDGERLVGALVKRFGQNQDHDGELLSDFGADFLSGAGASEEQVAALRAQARQHYEGRTDGRPQQIAARKALTAMTQLNIKGHITSYHQAGRMKLASLDASPMWIAQAIQDQRQEARDRRSR